MNYEIYTDGGARGNPGPGALGVVIKKDSEIILKKSKYLGKTTNNQAEYYAIIEGLKEAKSEKIKEIECYLDSELIVKQLSGEYRVKDKKLIPLYNKVVELKEEFLDIDFIHIPRSKNKEADFLVNEELDKSLK